MTSLYSDFAFSQANVISDSSEYKTAEIEVYSYRVSTDNFYSPTKIQLISNKEIENKNGESLADALQLADGVFIKTYGGNAALSTISMNGLGAEHTLILLNGFKLNSTQNSQLDLSTIRTDNIDRIEVLNNGSSSLYGSEAMGGVVNIVTKNNKTDNLNLNIKGQFGSYSQKLMQLRLVKSLGKLNVDFNLSKEASENNYSYFLNNGTDIIKKERDNSGFDISNYTLNINYLLNSNSKLNLYTDYNNISRNIPGPETGGASSLAQQTDNNWNSLAAYEYNLSDKYSFKSQLNYQNNLSEYSDKIFAGSYYRNIYLSNSSQIIFNSGSAELTAGYDFSYASLNSNETENNIKRFETGVFLVSEINAGSKFKLYPSVRFDNISDINKNVLSGKLGLNFRPVNDLNLNFKSSIGNNFSAPTFNELYWKELGNKNLIPEKSVNFDAGIIYGFSLFSENVFEFTYSHINAEEKIVWSPNSSGLWTPQNIGKSVSDIVSADFKIQKKFSEKLNSVIGINYSAANSVKNNSDFPGDPTFGKQMFYIPAQQMKVNFNIAYNSTGLNLFYSFTGKRFTDLENLNYLPAVDLVEGNIYQNINFDKFSAQVRLEVNNILNADYQIISGYPMPLRNYNLSFSLDY